MWKKASLLLADEIPKCIWLFKHSLSHLFVCVRESMQVYICLLGVPRWDQVAWWYFIICSWKALIADRWCKLYRNSVRAHSLHDRVTSISCQNPRPHNMFAGAYRLYSCQQCQGSCRQKGAWEAGSRFAHETCYHCVGPTWFWRGGTATLITLLIFAIKMFFWSKETDV